MECVPPDAPLSIEDREKYTYPPLAWTPIAMKNPAVLEMGVTHLIKRAIKAAPGYDRLPAIPGSH